jgi:hypothetical protein
MLGSHTKKKNLDTTSTQIQRHSLKNFNGSSLVFLLPPTKYIQRAENTEKPPPPLRIGDSFHIIRLCIHYVAPVLGSTVVTSTPLLQCGHEENYTELFLLLNWCGYWLVFWLNLIIQFIKKIKIIYFIMVYFITKEI